MIYGNLTKDPDVRALPNGNQVCSFSVATNRTYKDKEGNKQEQVEYHNVVAFGKLADIMGQYLKKGRPVLIEGRLQTRSWEQDGTKKYRTEIIADNFQFGTSATGGTSQDVGDTKTGNSKAGVEDTESIGKAPDYPEEEINPEDIPF